MSEVEAGMKDIDGLVRFVRGGRSRLIFARRKE